jgi:predicted RNA-binding protein with RPS1 domain
LDEKKMQQHSQHFNLSEEAKQKLEQLTARRYPGKKRRQSQLVEDLITQAFAKENSMNSVTQGMQEPEPDWLAPLTYAALNLAQQEAYRLEATEITPEHLLLGLVKQRERGVLNILTTLRVDVSAMRSRLDSLFIVGEHRMSERMRRRVEELRSTEKLYLREKLFAELKPGDMRRGVVSSLANFGAFVDLGGANGLVHISQLAWSHVNHPSEVLHVGQEVEVQVLSVDKEKKKIALSLKRAEVDPWTTVEQRYTPGQMVTGVVTKIAPFGAFARIEDGIEGLIHPSELPRGVDPKTVLHEGAQLQLRILRIDAERRRLGLSLRLAEEVGDNETVLEEPLTESDTQYGVDEIEKILLEDISAALEEVAVPDIGKLHGSLPLSSETQISFHEAVWIAQRMHSFQVQPEHLFLSILRNPHIQTALSPLLPFPEMLSGYTAVSSHSQNASEQGDTCPLCKHLLQSHWKHCVYCGQSLAKVCPQCGAPRAEIEGVRFCYECGSALE